MRRALQIAAILAFAALAIGARKPAEEIIILGGTSSASGSTPGGCTANGKTDWSNACDIPMGVALGVL